MGKQIKGGYLLRYKRDWLWRSWSEEWVVLYEDSTLAWFKDKGTESPRGRIRLSEAPDLLAVGEWTRHVPRRPRVPSDCHIAQLLAFASRQHNKVHWLMAQSPQEVSDWMTAISNTLPPPPRLAIDRNKRCSAIREEQNGVANGYSNGYSTCSSLSRSHHSYSNDHIVPPGVVIDWGHGWGWGEVAWAAQLASAQESAINNALYCSTQLDDYGVGGYEDVDYSACGDFSF